MKSGFELRWCSCNCDAIRERLRLGGPVASIQYSSNIITSNYRESAANSRTSHTSETSVGRVVVANRLLRHAHDQNLCNVHNFDGDDVWKVAAKDY